MRGKKHKGFTIVEDDKGVTLEPMPEHREDECEAETEKAVQRHFGHEIVYEAPDAASTRTSVGYNRMYANNYDAAFGKKSAN